MLQSFDGHKAVHYQELDPGNEWVKDSDIAINSNGPLDSGGVYTPNVIKVPSGGYRMYYFGVSTAGSKAKPVGSILSAYSDDAYNWNKEAGIRLDSYNKLPGGTSLSPDVIPLPDGRFRMYLSFKQKNRPDVILSAISDDGLDWKYEPGFRWADSYTSCGTPRCVYTKVGSNFKYRLYFFQYKFPFGPVEKFEPGQDSMKHIVSAISDDGLNFEMEPGIRVSQEFQFENYAIYAPDVVLLADETYRMYYSSWEHAPEVTTTSKFHGRVFSATSEDGLRWYKDPKICVDIGGPWDGIKASEPCVIDIPDGSSRLFYEACDVEGQWRILSATSV
mgnify:FL=1